jgi:glucose/arabinose dehydrogenase
MKRGFKFQVSSFKWRALPSKARWRGLRRENDPAMDKRIRGDRPVTPSLFSFLFSLSSLRFRRRAGGLVVAALALLLMLGGCFIDDAQDDRFGYPALATATLQPGQPSPTEPPGTTPDDDPLITATRMATETAAGDVPTAARATDVPATGEQPDASPTEEASVPTQAPVGTRVVEAPGAVSLPEGFGISVFAEGLSDPRMLEVGPDGQLYVAERGAGRVVRLPDADGDGVADGAEVVASSFDQPSSIAFYKDGSLYVAETGRVIRMSEPDGQGVFTRRETIISGIPSGGHVTRTLRFSPDWATLYVSVGSSCNVCVEEDERRATILRFAPDGSGGAIFARGLRNAVGLAIRPGSDELWASNNGRDNLGDDLPPETVNLARAGDDFGWPRCHAGDLEDPEFGGDDACAGVKAPEVKMQAHSAPLGLAFYTGSQFPEAYQGDLFVAFHGSWNRSVPTGYKVVRIPLDGGQAGEAEDFATGFRPDAAEAWGRPVDLATARDGSLLLSDDAGGRIYRIFYKGG